MKLTLTPSQMLDRWRLHRACCPPLSDAVFRRNDGIDTDAIFTAEMNRWYLDLLLTAPPSQLSIHSLDADLASLPSMAGATVMKLPPGVVRVLDVRLSSWLRPARIVADPDCRLLRCQTHPYTRATASCPLAFFHKGELRLYPAARPGDSFLALDCVIHDDSVYEFDDSALASLHQ